MLRVARTCLIYIYIHTVVVVFFLFLTIVVERVRVCVPRRVIDGPGARRLRHQAAFHDVRRVHNARQQHHGVGGVRVLAVRRARLVRGPVQGTELHERQLVTGTRVEGTGPQTGSVRQRFQNAARPHAQLH